MSWSITTFSKLIGPAIWASLAAPLRAAGEGKVDTIVIVADSRHLGGIEAWWANLYNESHFYFALLTILLVPAAGALLGCVADFLLSRIGIDLKSRVLRES